MTPEQVFEQMVADGDMVLDQLDRCAREHPDKTYLHYGEDGLKLSFAQVKALSDRAAAGLVAMGLPAGATAVLRAAAGAGWGFSRSRIADCRASGSPSAGRCTSCSACSRL